MYLASLVFSFVKQNMMHIAGPKNWKMVALIVIIFKSSFCHAVGKMRVRGRREALEGSRGPCGGGTLLALRIPMLLRDRTKIFFSFTVRLYNAYFEGFLGSE